MRTKALLGLAALAVGLSTSVAQNVYSLNVVGYVNVTVKGNGYTLCANQLNNGTNGIAQVLPNPTEGALVLTFKNNNYNIDIASTGAWYDNSTGNPSTTALPPGTGWFYNNPNTTASTLTLVGEVPQGAGLAVALPSGYALVGTYTPTATSLSTTNGFPVVEGMLYLTFNNAINNYVISIASGGAWYDNATGDPIADPTPAVSQGYFINNPAAATTWTRNFTVQ
jgi:hypothetical protein